MIMMVSKQYLYDTLSVTVPQVFVIMVIFDAVITIMMTMVMMVMMIMMVSTHYLYDTLSVTVPQV